MPVPWSALTAREKTVENVRANFYGRRYFYIYKNTDVFPRFFTVSGINVYDGSQALLDAMADASVGDLRYRAFVAKRDLP